MNKPVYLGVSVQKLSKILRHDFWCDYVKPRHVLPNLNCVIWIVIIPLYP